MRAVAASTSSAVGSAIFSALGLLIVARQGRITEIGNYTAGTVSLAIVAVALSAGTNVRVWIGEPAERLAALKWRLRVVAPTLLVFGALLTPIFGKLGFNQAQFFAAALSIFVNNLIELHNVSLRRQVRFGLFSATALITKAAAVAAIGAGVTLSFAVLGASLVQLGWLEISNEPAERLTTALRSRKPARHVARSWDTSGTTLAVFTIAEYAGNRFDSLIISLTYGPTTTGLYGATYSVFLATIDSIVAVANVTVSLERHNAPHRLAARQAARRTRALAIALAVVAGIALYAAAGDITRFLFGHQEAAATNWLRVLALAVLPYTIARTQIFKMLAKRRPVSAMISLAPSVFISSLLMAILIPLIGPIMGTVLTLSQELAAAAIALSLRDRTRRSRNGGGASRGTRDLPPPR
jgi:O-antigen/teichoic acid export membrane protein